MRAAESLGRARAARDEAASAVLRLEPLSTLGNVAIPAALAAGMLAGGMVVLWWLEQPLVREWPRLATVIGLASSTVVLLRGAWKTGRITGARGPR